MPEFAYPERNEIIPIWAAAMLAFFVPTIVFLICQIRARSFWDVNNAVLGLLYSLIGAAVFQVFVKWLIGGVSPRCLLLSKTDTDIQHSFAHTSLQFASLMSPESQLVALASDQSCISQTFAQETGTRLTTRSNLCHQATLPPHSPALCSCTFI